MPKKEALITNGLGAKLRDERVKADLTEEVVAERADINTRYLSAIEKGEKTPSAEVVFRIIRAIGASADIIAYPEANTSDSNNAQLVRLIHTCDVRDRRAVKAMVTALLDTKELTDEE